MKPDRFADIIATNALYRPGPLNGGMVDEYVDVKNGRKQATYLHPVLKEVLEETYGVMVYQEQVMRILNRLGGIELSKAYATIKAISKKKADVIAESRDQFVAGGRRARAGSREGAEDLRPDRVFRRLRLQQVAQHGLRAGRLPDRLSEELIIPPSTWPRCSRRRWTAPSATSSSSSTSTIAGGWASRCCRPTSTRGSRRSGLASEGQIHFGLGAIKGVGFKAVEAIVKAREQTGPVPEPGRLLRAGLDPRSRQRLRRDA